MCATDATHTGLHSDFWRGRSFCSAYTSHSPLLGWMRRFVPILLRVESPITDDAGKSHTHNRLIGSYTTLLMKITSYDYTNYFGITFIMSDILRYNVDALLEGKWYQWENEYKGECNLIVYGLDSANKSRASIPTWLEHSDSPGICWHTIPTSEICSATVNWVWHWLANG